MLGPTSRATRLRRSRTLPYGSTTILQLHQESDMASQDYSVFIGADQNGISLDPAISLAQARNAISAVSGADGQPIMSATDNFLYANPITNLTTVFWPVSAESEARLSSIQFPAVPTQGVNNPIIQIVSTAQDDQSLLGMQP